MEYNVTELTNSEKEVEIKLPFEEIKPDLESEVKKQTKKIQLPGFRKGKVPIHILKKMYGDALEYEASEKVANNIFWKVANENELKPIGQPTMTDIKFEPGKELSFKVKYEIVPVLEVKDYKNIEIEIPDFKVTEEEVDREIQYILRSNRSLEDTDIVGADDNYVLDSEIYRLDKEGSRLEDVKPEKLQIDLTQEGVQKEIVENAKNKKVDDTFRFSFKDERIIKNDKNEDETVVDEYFYESKILGIKKINYPELNEEFIKKATKDKVSTKEDLREEIKKDIQAYYDQKVEEITRGKLISEIVKNNDFTPPSSLVNNILEEYVKSEEEQAKKNNYKFSKEESKNRNLKAAENEVKWYLIKNEIVKKENISVSEDELKALAEKDAKKTGIPVDKLLNYYKSTNQAERSIDQKLFEYLKENNTLKKVDPKSITAKKEA